MLKHIDVFPYGKPRLSNPMHKKLLLLELNAVLGRHFTIGYYDAVMDVFCTWSYPGFMQTKGHRYDERTVSGRGLFCILPEAFKLEKGPRLIKGWAPIEEIYDELRAEDKLIRDVEAHLLNVRYCTPYLVVTENSRLIVSEASCFCDSGNQFEAFSPCEINGHIYHCGGPIPVDDIRYVADLSCLEYETVLSRMVDADKLFEAIKQNDLDYMPQADVMECIKDTIDRFYQKG